LKTRERGKAMQTVVLRNIEGEKKLSGTDSYNNKWVEFEVDYGALQTTDYCVICGAEIESGWECLDGGEVICDEHVKCIP